MLHRFGRFALVSAAAGSLAAAGFGTATAAPATRATSVRNTPVCSVATTGLAACNAIRHDRVSADGKVVPNLTPAGYGPADIQAAYGLGGGSGQTVAIIDAYDLPTAESDLGVYRSQYGLPACTTANGCFKKVGQTGGTVPKANSGWGQEIALDIDMVSAACPGCHILLVEATSATNANLGAAVNYAATQGVVAISNSYGGPDQAETSAYNHPGIAITASTGDSGYGVQSPASGPHVIAVGGTSLNKVSGIYTQSAWSGAGSGCSTLNAKPIWQTAATSCPSGKANADVSAVADPNTGVAVYDSTPNHGSSGWLVFGGTSVSSPIIGSAYALGGNHGLNYPAQYTWGQTASLTDVTTGSNGTCPTTVWCNAGTGWDGPTGLGTPNGTGAF